jgi:N-dimethylarginine dimethylaminohydrolase
VLMCMLGERLAAVCVDAVSTGLLRWLEQKKVEVVPVSLEDALGLGVNGVCLGGDRVLSTSASAGLNGQLCARGITVLDPDLSAFTLGGGGAHCLMQAIRRERVARGES